MHIFCGDVEISTIREYHISDHVSDTNTLKSIIENIKNGHRLMLTKPQSLISVLYLIMSFLLLV